ncbi:calmodulin-binding transcription activator 4-like isoform X2 [Telopea speciosissima]|uniref:calmodulin-binding transcription activator 4-like isoform X2 n=1 Tax=Telopea speciosissima TaxID=54955 RepID=UPI001CC7BE26|nr:calmodulin-binding transcription activator 4-like isoform X2 [Telopea speciosissima]
MKSGFDIKELVQEAHSRWLKPAEVLFILQNHENHQIMQEAPQKPSSGSLFLFNKRVLRFFRRDGHMWRKKRDGRTVGEAHERLKVGNVEALNCYYAHGEQNPNFQRRSYWMLDPAYDHIVLVHYREVSEGRHNAGSLSYLSPGFSSTPSQSTTPCTAQNTGSLSGTSEFYESSRNCISPGSVEVSSESVISTELDHLDQMERSREFSSSSEPEVNQALRRLQEQLSLNDDDLAEELSSYCTQMEKTKDSGILDFEMKGSKQDKFEVLPHGPEYKICDQHYSWNAGGLENSNNHQLLQHTVDREHLGSEYTLEKKESLSWKEMLESCSTSTGFDSREKFSNISDGNTLEHEKPVSSERGRILGSPVGQQETWTSQRLDFHGNSSENRLNYYTTSESDSNMQMQLSVAREFLLGSDSSLVSPTSTALPQVVESSKRSAYSWSMWFDQENHLEVPLEGHSSLSIAQKQRFTIHEISPDWGYATEATKVIIIGSFLCDPSEFSWNCMFGDTEVPLEIIQDGVLRCKAPPHGPGNVSLCITCGNRESCSEIREFTYNIKQGSCTHCDLPQKEVTKSTEELLLLVRFAQMLVCDPLAQREDIDEDPWGHIIDTLLVGSETPLSTVDWLVQELLKDKLQCWLLSKYQAEGDTLGCSLSKKEQRIIHTVAGLGFEWALNPILNSGISINFRDVNGWTALHWAARFGREKMVAALLAAGASAGAVTDPTSQDPTGQSPASIAAANGHKGLAGYLSEVALTSHLSSLKLEETELSKGAAAVEAERTMENIFKESLGATEDQLSLRDSLAAVRNAAQAAARIQSAFRAHSFRKRQQREAVVASSVDGYDITTDDILELSAASKLAFRNLRDHKLDKAALSIQKKYRGWKGRKEFLALRQKVVKIQAHVRGHQVRKKYKMVWAVGVLDKVVLRWRRRGVGLRGFRPESKSVDESEDEDILKVFRKQKVDVATDEAVGRVMSMVESPQARQQYRRMLESYQQAKAKLSGAASEATLTPQCNFDDMENDYMYQFP